MKLNNEDVQEIELELTGTCNLDCPLCARNYEEAKNLKISNQRPLKDIIAQLDTFPNLRNVCLAGIISEPTLYKQLMPLLTYLINRNIEIELYSNADTHDAGYWERLGSTVRKGNIKVFFTVCGSTQELHAKYRVGSNLDRILIHHEAFKKGNFGKGHDYLQHIMFNYNESDFQNMDSIRALFSNECNIQSLPYQERFDIKDDKGIKMTDELSSKYQNIIKFGKSKLQDGTARLNCKSLEMKFLALDQFGNATPCFLYRLHQKENFDQDYTKILNGEYSFCYECESNTCGMLEKNNLERMT